MIDDALTNPPVPEWNNLTNEERQAICNMWEIHSCPHACGGSAIYMYAEIRRVLQEREKRYLKATMIPNPVHGSLAMRNDLGVVKSVDANPSERATPRVLPMTSDVLSQRVTEEMERLKAEVERLRAAAERMSGALQF